MSEENKEGRNVLFCNKALLEGIIVDEPRHIWTIQDENFYELHVESHRTKKKTDIIPVVISELLFTHNLEGKCAYVIGEFCSKNIGGHVKMFLEAEKISTYNVDESYMRFTRNKNDVYLRGVLCKKQYRRTTLLGKRIADLVIAVGTEETSYISCIAWDDKAEYTKELEYKAIVEIEGHMQSRQYIKKISETLKEQRTAYEVSISKIQKI